MAALPLGFRILLRNKRERRRRRWRKSLQRSSSGEGRVMDAGRVSDSNFSCENRERQWVKTPALRYRKTTGGGL